METYNYYDAVKSDVESYLLNHDFNGLEFSNFDDFKELLYDDLFIYDGVTGNASGSYTFNTWEAEENLCHNLDLLGEALDAFGSGPEYIIENGPEACDVTIRCYLLSQVLDDMENDLQTAYESFMEDLDNE